MDLSALCRSVHSRRYCCPHPLPHLLRMALPYKAVTEFVEVTSIKTLIQTIIFVTLFIGLVIILPLLMKRRAQCGIFCPFGAFQSLTNKVSAFEVRIDQEKCTKCLRCALTCPTFSIDNESIGKGKNTDHLHPMRQMYWYLSEGSPLLSCEGHTLTEHGECLSASLSLSCLFIPFHNGRWKH